MVASHTEGITKWQPLCRWHLQMYFHILFQISLKFLPNGPTNNELLLVQVMAWCGTDWPFCSGAHFTNGIDILIQIWWTFHSALIQVLVKWSLWNFAHGTTAVLSCHVQNCVVIWYTRARRFPLPDGPGQVKLPVGQVGLNKFFLFISYEQIEEFQISLSQASDDFEKRQALYTTMELH